MSDDEMQCTPPELREIALDASNKLVPAKSQKQYEKAHKRFLNWATEHNVKSITENVLIAYFEVMGKTKKSSTIWTNYSMLRTMLNIKENIDISKFARLIALLKTFSKGYLPKKSKILEFEHITKFLGEAPDNIYLAVKVNLYSYIVSLILHYTIFRWY
ncbi:hypothetical protein RI129_012511 [Pyrocoelia pectoralis]|uniref:Core-binding (CB) domain-containing protein n=1 Tax=Pyrocoelia pectoralis TaxID=417401 RepID=A0AAN7V2X9_9COLE